MFWRGLGNPWAGFREIDRLFRDLQRIFSEYDRSTASYVYPAVNIYSGKDGAVVTAELPGMEIGDIEISVVGNTLTIQGNRKLEEHERTWHRRECPYGEFTRTLDLPFTIDRDKVEARLNKGILAINLPRAEEDKPRKIPVKAS